MSRNGLKGVHNRSTLDVSSVFTPKEEDKPIEKRKARLGRLDAIFSTAEWKEAVATAQREANYLTTVDDLIEWLWANSSRCPDEKRAGLISDFEEKYVNFPIDKLNEISQKHSCTVLYTACRNGWYEIVDLLLSEKTIKTQGFQSVKPHNSSTCLHGANWGGFPDVCAYLLDRGTKPEKNIDGGDHNFPYEEVNEDVDEKTQGILSQIWESYARNEKLTSYYLDPKKIRRKPPGINIDKEITELDFKLNTRRLLSEESAYGGEEFDLDDAAAPTLSPASDGGSDTFKINDRFQQVAAKLFALKTKFNEIPDVLQKLNIDFVQVSRDFLHFAKSISKVIISERYIPIESKTIKPLKLGGVIGGDKYIVQAVLFKFAIEREEEGVTSQIAEKIAGHELKSLSHVWECKIPNVFLPLQCLINYLGFRMNAMLLLPIGPETLKVGSNDACKTYHSDCESLSQKFKEIGESLNLAPHVFRDHTLYGPFDLEGHVGTDGKEYIIDFSRLFPPVPKSERYPSGFLYRLFRPEFVKRYHKKLCSDGFSAIVADNFNQDLIEAEKHLFTNTIPTFSAFLNQFIPIVVKLKMVEPGNFVFHISRTLHEAGINVRYLGEVYRCCFESKTRELLLIEMAARVIKQVLREKIREKMKQFRFPLEHPYIELLVDYLNVALFNNDEKTEAAWEDIQTNIINYFDIKKEDSTAHLFQPHGVKNIIWKFSVLNHKDFHMPGPKLLFDRIRQMMGFKVNKTYLHKLYTSKENVKLNGIVLSIGQRIKHMNIISHAEGWLLREDDMELSLQKFDMARNSLPINKYTLRNYAQIYFNLRKSEKDEAFVTYLKYLFNLALSEDTKDTHTLYQYGNILYDIGETGLAEEYLTQAIEAHPEHKEAWIKLITILKNTVAVADLKKIIRTVNFKFSSKK